MMKLNSKFIALGAGCLALTAFSPLARATDLLNDPADVITASDPTQLGRIRRDTSGADLGYGLQQTWTPSVNGQTSYPGAANTATSYTYMEYSFTPAQLGDGKYIQIDFDEPASNDLFVSAWTVYTGTASVASGAGFLGSAGQSGNYQGTPDTPRYFNVTVPAGESLVVVVNTTNPAAIGETYGIQVEDFTDTAYTDAVIAPVPEPSTWAMLGAGGLVLGGVTMARRRRASAV